jgi:hypothetical protein
MEHPYRAPAPLAAPPRPETRLLTVVAIACLALAAFTSNKLYRMAQLRGDLPGIPERTMVVTRELRRFGMSALEVEVIDAARPAAGAWKHQIATDGGVVFTNIVGSELRLRCIDSSRDCYGPGSVYIDDGNRSFDVGLLCLELAGLAAAGFALWRRRRAYRGALRAVTLPAQRG